LEEADIRAAIERAIGGPAEYEILSILPWLRRELVADTYRLGRAFLAGDSAHVMSPTGGFGMNSGIADAVDLSWKLTALLQGWGGERLLDSYEIERQPVARRAAREATANLARTLAPGANPALLDRTFEGAKLRYEIGRRYSATMLREWYKLGIDLGYIYRGSPICVPDEVPILDSDGSLSDPSHVREVHKVAIHRAEGFSLELDCELTPEEVMIYRPSAEPGARAPHVWLEPGTSILDLFGSGFTLLLIGPEAPSVTAFVERAAAIGLPFAVHEVVNPKVRELYGAPLVLIRPDGHVAWRGSSAADAARILDIVRGV